MEVGPKHRGSHTDLLRPKGGAIEMQLRTLRATCPACGTVSRRVHSCYGRTLEDLPWEGLRVRILLETRRFFCVAAIAPGRSRRESFDATAEFSVTVPNLPLS